MRKNQLEPLNRVRNLFARNFRSATIFSVFIGFNERSQRSQAHAPNTTITRF